MADKIIIDVREPEEFAMDHVAGAINIPPMELMNGTKKLDKVPKDTPIILYCRTGQRSNSSMPFLHNMGFTNLTNGINKEQVEARFL